jgi:hypothetical protein
MLRRPKVTATVLSASILTLFLVSLSPLPQLLAASTTSGNGGSGATLNPVQISIQTKNLTSVSSYDLVGYNSTGAAVASYTGQYQRVTFDLPAGTYLFAATANGPNPSQSPVCCVCVQKGQATGTVVVGPPAQAPTAAGAAGSSAIGYPCYVSNPALEFGYSLTQVTSGPTTITIATQSPSAIPTAALSVSLSYKNGTAVSDAYVSASGVGTNWYWGDVSGVTMYAQTGADGVAHLVVPAVALIVTASKSVQVDLPKSQTTMQVNVGGQLVNVTLYYSPNYVYLSAEALLIPPQATLSMVVTAQTQSQLIPYAAGAASSPGQAVTNGAAVPPSSGQGLPTTQAAGAGAQTSTVSVQTSRVAAAAPAAIPPIPASDLGAPPSTQPSSNSPSISVLAIGTVVLAGAVAAVVGIAISRARR